MISYYVYEFEDEVITKDLSDYDLWPFFRMVAAEIAMSDCSGANVTKIVYKGNEYYYAGWKPGMEFEFINRKNPEDRYTTWMEHLDH